MIDILAVSSPSVTAVNRAVFRRLAARGWRIELAIPTALLLSGGLRQADPRSAGDPPLHLLSTARRRGRTERYVALVQLLRDLRPRVVYLDGDPASLLALELGAHCRRSGTRLVCQTCENERRLAAEDVALGRYRRVPKSLVIRILRRAAAQLVDYVLPISEEGVEIYRRSGFAGRVRWIPLGYDETLFFPSASLRESTRDRLGLTVPTIACFGRVAPEKGIDLLLRSLAALQSRRPDLAWRLLFDRFTEHAAAYEQQVRSQIGDLGLSARVVYFDASHEEMPKYFNAADIVVVPSRQGRYAGEQYGRVVPEAMACGKAVVATTSGALPALLGGCGVVVPSGSQTALSDAVEWLLGAEDLRSALGAAGSQRARAVLSTAAQALVIEEVLGHLRVSP